MWSCDHSMRYNIIMIVMSSQHEIANMYFMWYKTILYIIHFRLWYAWYALMTFSGHALAENGQVIIITYLVHYEINFYHLLIMIPNHLLEYTETTVLCVTLAISPHQYPIISGTNIQCDIADQFYQEWPIERHLPFFSYV